MRQGPPYHDADPPNAQGGGTDPADAAQDALSAAADAVSNLAADAADAARGASKTAEAHPASDDAAQAVDLPTFAGQVTPAQARALDLLSDVNLNVKIELGRTRMLVEDVLRLGEGAVVELDKLAGDPVDVYVNERHIARGEVLVLNDNFCVRINEIVQSPVEQRPAEPTKGEGAKKSA